LAEELIPHRTVSALMLATVIAGFAVYRSSTYQECTADKGKQASYQQQYERYGPLMVYIDCLGPFSHENHSPITAAFTVILALSTIALWVSTRDSALAARAAAEHIPRVERAYIYGGFGPHSGGRRYATDENGNDFIVASVTMANYGKTPGFIKTIRVT
jgi:hypothetical protein